MREELVFSDCTWQKASPQPATLLSASGACFAKTEAERRIMFFIMYTRKNILHYWYSYLRNGVLEKFYMIGGSKKMLFICYPKCSTCQRAKKWLDGHNIEYTERHIAEDNPSYDELKEWYEKSGLPLKKFFNTSGMVYREMQLKDRLPSMNEEEQLKLLATDGMLVKRPLIVSEDIVLVGFKEAEWANMMFPD